MILALIIFAAVFLNDTKKNYKDNKYGWKFALGWTILAVAFWYFFDVCREFKWFLYGSIIIAIVSHLIFLNLLKKKPKKLKVDSK